MSSVTPNLGLVQPYMTDEVDQTIPALATNFGNIDTSMGKLANLTTTDKTNLVNAINENKTNITALEADVEQRAINVKSAPYNAVGDGVTDDTAAIQAAINNYSVIVIPEGQYKITAPIVIPSGKTILGIGMTKSKLIYTGALCAIDMGGNSHPVAATAYITLRDLGIQLNQDAIGINIENSYFNTFDNVYVYANAVFPTHLGTGVKIKGKNPSAVTVPAYYNKFTNCVFSLLTTGALLTDGANSNKFTSCEMSTCETGAIVQDSNGNVFVGDTFQDFTVKAIYFSDSGAGNTFGNNVIGCYIEAKTPVVDYPSLVCGIHFTSTCQFNFMIGNIHTTLTWSAKPNIIDDNPNTTNMRLEWAGNPAEALHFPSFATPPLFSGGVYPGANQANRGGLAVVEQTGVNDKLVTVLRDAAAVFTNYRLPLIKDATNVMSLGGVTLYDPTVKLGTVSTSTEGYIWYQTSAKKVAVWTSGWRYLQDIYADTTTNIKAISASVLSAGQMAYSTTLSRPVWWDGSAWKDSAGIAV